MNVLLITYSFPPAGGVGVMRASALARYLPNDDIAVQVLTTRNASCVGSDRDLLSGIPATVQIYRSYAPDLPFGIRKRLKQFGRYFLTEHAGAGLPNRRLSTLANLISPDPQVLWCPFALRKARKIIEASAIDCVIITVPPFSLLTLSFALKANFPKLKIVLDFRDEWLASYFHSLGFNQSDAAKRRAEIIERSAVDASDLVVMVSRSARYAMQARYPHSDPYKFQVVFNGFEPADLGPIVRSSAPGKKKVCYLGSIYRSAEPSTFIRALHHMDCDARAKLEFLFVGNVDGQNYRRDLTSIGSSVHLKPFAPQQQAFAMLRDSDFALLIWHDTMNIPAKFYDYLASGKPVLGLIRPNSELAHLFTETQCGFVADVRCYKSIATLLTNIVRDGDNMLSAFAPNSRAVQRFLRTTLISQYASLLQGGQARKSMSVPASMVTGTSENLNAEHFKAEAGPWKG